VAVAEDPVRLGDTCFRGGTDAGEVSEVLVDLFVVLMSVWPCPRIPLL
jgi:hypothetical protein